jgi:dTDP-4-dehydrorhamnose reductase
MRVAVTGATGRLGQAVIDVLEEAPFTGPAGPIAWAHDDFDLDEPKPGPLLARDRPEVVIHTAAWTDVDGCARDPEAAGRRNGEATGALARACAAAEVDLIAISTNEVFDGQRADGQGYRPGDRPNPINAYGASKLLGERLAADAFGTTPSRGASLSIIRTAWLFGPPGADFPSKILAAASSAMARDEPLRVVVDEVGSPTYSADLAEAIVELISAEQGGVRGTHHIVNTGRASRADWAREVLRISGLEVHVEEVAASTWQRASTPPLWAVLEPTPLPSGEPLRSWQAAVADYAPVLRRQQAASAR